MKQRIRTVKPEFFAHEVLFDAEQETGLPLRLAFIGLWSCCDREGRFEWRPRPLKSYIMPYDDVDFSRVLDALASRGFVVKYASDGREYGRVPSWKRHQVINNRETPSELPENGDVVEIECNSTRESRVPDTSVTCTSGREGKGRELEGKELRAKALLSFSNDDVKSAFDAYNEMATQAGLPEAQILTDKRKTALRARLKDAGGIEGWMAALGKVAASPHCTGGNERGWKADLDFISTQSKFVNIMEGRYDQSTPNNQHAARNAGPSRAVANLRSGFQASAASDPARGESGDGFDRLPF